MSLFSLIWLWIVLDFPSFHETRTANALSPTQPWDAWQKASAKSGVVGNDSFVGSSISFILTMGQKPNII